MGVVFAYKDSRRSICIFQARICKSAEVLVRVHVGNSDSLLMVPNSIYAFNGNW